MKLRIFLISIAALLSTQVFACGIYEYLPSEYLLFRVHDCNIKDGVGIEISQLSESDDPEVIEYLKLARMCEDARNKLNSKWYYPHKECPVLQSLNEVVDRSMKYSGEKLKDRYALQAVRAMFSLGRHKELVDWWEKNANSIDDEPIRESIRGYVAGSYFRVGQEEKAFEYYNRIGDLQSIIFCLKQQGKYEGDEKMLAYAAENCPDSPYVSGILQRYVGCFEDGGININANVSECYNICMKAAARSKKPARWLYSAAFLKNLMGQPYVASGLLGRAEKCADNEFIGDSIRILMMLIDARNSTYDREYEAKLLNELKWLDGKICSNIDKQVIDETSEGWRLKNGLSYYYWNDMMRKIVLGTVVPRMVESGRIPTALLLANYADNRLLSLVDKVEIGQFDQEGKYITYSMTLDKYRNSETFNMFDYSNHYFRLLDSVGVEALISYAGLLKSPSAVLEKFLITKAYIDDDYINDLIGTRFMRSMRYSDAVTYLAKVSSDYQRRLNTYPYMERLPFKYGPERGTVRDNYKLSFARKMVAYESVIKSEVDQDKVGEAMVMMGIGIKSSFDFCWSLTHYSKSEYNPWYEEKQNLANIDMAEGMIKKGLSKIRNRELAAECYRRIYYFKTIMEKFPDTKVGREVLEHCDNADDYKEKKQV